MERLGGNIYMNSTYIIGITGSVGKTSCAQGLYDYLTSLGYQTGLISSNKILINDYSSTSGNYIRDKQE